MTRFRRQLIEQWSSTLSVASKDYMIPFHHPHKTCVAGKHRSLPDVLYNNIALAESRGLRTLLLFVIALFYVNNILMQTLWMDIWLHLVNFTVF